MRVSLIVLGAAALAMRIWMMIAWRVDSDEPQHLHVAWVWSQGLVPYRDLFDNHVPLLHLLFAPVMTWMPETSAVFPLMRLAIAPFAIGAAVLLFAIARPVTGTRTAAIAAIAFSAVPPWLPKSVEFRNDTLWVFFWLAAVLFISRRKPFLAGFAIGLALLASVKTLPLLLAHALALATTRDSPRDIAHALIGMAIPIAALSAPMAAAGVLDDMLYRSLVFNTLLPIDTLRRFSGAIVFAIVALLVFRKRRSAPHLSLFAFWYTLVILTLWPIVTPRDFLPLAPLAALAVVRRWPSPHWIAVAMVATLLYGRVWKPVERSREQFVDAVAQLTSPHEYVFDLKGDAIFRRRPVPAVYEQVNRALTANGTVRDLGPEAIVANGCCVAIDDTPHLPARTRAFLAQHFIDTGPLRVCGTVVRGNTFDIAVPQHYAVVTRDRSRVSIDGVPYRGARYLAAGRHTITGMNGPVTVIWRRVPLVEQLAQR